MTDLLIGQTDKATSFNLDGSGIYTQIGSQAVLIGVSKFGNQVLQAVDQASRTRTGFQMPVGVWLGPDGWSSRWDSDITQVSWSDPANFWEEHRSQGMAALEEAYYKALGFNQEPAQFPGRSQTPRLDLYLAIHLCDPASQELWPRLLELCRLARVAFTELVITLFVASDLVRIRHYLPDEAVAFQKNLSLLSNELLISANEEETAGRFGWCYWIDSLDMNSRPLQPVEADETSNPTSSLAQAQQAADMIALLCAGLRNLPAYEQTSLTALSHSLRNQPPASRVSTLGSASLVLPIMALQQRASNELALRLLIEVLNSPARPGDLPEARLLFDQWMDEFGLTQQELRRSLQKDLSGEPLVFVVEPLHLEQVPDDALIDLLLNWDFLLWQRWNHPASAAHILVQNADLMVDRAGAVLDGNYPTVLKSLEVSGRPLASLPKHLPASRMRQGGLKSSQEARVTG